MDPLDPLTRRRLGLVLRALIGVVPLAWLAGRVDPHAIAADVAVAGPWLVVGAGLYVASLLACTARWRAMLAPFGRPPSFGEALRLYLVAVWFNLLPAGVVGDGLRGWRTREIAGDARTAVAIVVVERALGMVGLAAISLAARPWVPVASRVLDGADLVAAGLVVGAVATVLALPAVPSPFRRPGMRAALAAALGWSVVNQVLVVASIGVCAAAVSPLVTAAVAARLLPLVVLATVFPITPAGFGQREAAFTWFLGLVGVAPDEAVAVGLLAFCVGLVGAGAGGLLHVLTPVAAGEAAGGHEERV